MGTMVIIHKGMEHMAMAHPGATSVEVAQHLAVTGHYVPKAGKHADYFYILPSIHADWAWYNEVDWLVALVNFGGSGASDAQLGISLWLCAVFLTCIVVIACTSIWCIAIVLRKTSTSIVRCCSAQRNQIVNILREVKVRRKKYFP